MMPASHRATRLILFAACALILACYGAMIDLKGISTDEGMRLAIVNGGAGYTPGVSSPAPSWGQVLEINRHCAYQPLYFLLLNTLMRVTGNHDLVLFRSVGIAFLALCLLGLLTLSRAWGLVPRLFLLGLFSFNAFLFMHVLQIREYTAGLAFYIWSTWLVLRLDARSFGCPWADVAWFSTYGVLLTLGFYLQSWVVFPAIAQGLFLLARRPGDRLRFYARLALSYLIVLAATVPYLLGNPQKAVVGRWGTTGLDLGPQLSTGFHLVLAGHLPGQHGFSDLLFWVWLAAIVLGATVTLGMDRASAPVAADSDDRRSGRLALLCSGAALAFQIGYALRVENLSLWPRYFVIHYFFLTWLIAVGFNWLWTGRRDRARPRVARAMLTAAACLLMAVAAGSAVFQTRSYHRDPYLDTGFTGLSNWRSWTRDLARVIRPDDVMLTHDYISRATLTVQLPMANRQLLLHELEDADLREARRVVCLASPAQRGTLEAALLGQGFANLQEFPMYSVDGRSVISDLRILVFSRD